MCSGSFVFGVKMRKSAGAGFCWNKELEWITGNYDKELIHLAGVLLRIIK